MSLIDCWKVENDLKTTPVPDCALNVLTIDEPLENAGQHRRFIKYQHLLYNFSYTEHLRRQNLFRHIIYFLLSLVSVLFVNENNSFIKAMATFLFAAQKIFNPMKLKKSPISNTNSVMP